MRHRSKEGKRDEQLQGLIEFAHKRYVSATVSEKEAIHAEIVAHSAERETLGKKIHRYMCIGCDAVYTAKSAHGVAYLVSWTRYDETGRPVRAETFGVRGQPKIGFCSNCADVIEADIDSE